MKFQDKEWMGVALTLAAKAKGLTSPNPCVGAILVKNKTIIGQGYHRKAGTPHAEVLAIRDAYKKGFSPRGATLYVTLEPCCSQGRTPPCTDLIIREKIKRVVMGALDPNPLHAGKGPRILKKAGLEVQVGVRAKECEFLNRDFNHWIVHRTPWVTLKSAMSYDGRITRPPGEGSWLTSEKSRTKAHELREECDAILVGAETVRQDNPQLTIRLKRNTSKPQPWRVILTKSGKIPSKSKIFKDPYKDRTLVYGNQTLNEVMKDLGSRGVMNLLVEGGGRVHSAFLKEKFVHEVAIFWAPMITGTPVLGFSDMNGKAFSRSILLTPWSFEKVENDLFVRAIVN